MARKSKAWGINNIKHFEFVYKKKKISLLLNPETFEWDRPQRTSTYKAQGSTVIQQYGAEPGSLTMSGTTGWHKDSSGKNGKSRFRELVDLATEYQNDTQNGGAPADFFYVNDYTDDLYFTVTFDKKGFSWARNVENPLVYTYSFNFTVISGTGSGGKDSVISATIGTGSGSSIDKGSEDTSNKYHDMDEVISNIESTNDSEKAKQNAINKLKKVTGK